MAELKLVIGNKNGKSYQKVLEDKANFIGRKIGDKIKGELFGMAGYEFLISGGSDDCGFPMRKGIESSGKKKILALGGVGFKKKKGLITLVTSGLTSIGLYAVAVAFFTVSLYYSTIIVATNATLWLILFIQRIIYKKA